MEFDNSAAGASGTLIKAGDSLNFDTLGIYLYNVLSLC